MALGGSLFPSQGWHRCRRFWRRGFECPYHGKRERDRKSDDEADDLERRDPRSEPSTLSRTKVGVAPTPGIAQVADAIPGVLAQVGKAERRPIATVAEQLKPPIVVPSIPDVAGTPLYVPDEVLEEWTPPGKGVAMANVGAVAEETFAALISKSSVGSIDETAEIGQLAMAQEEAQGTRDMFAELALAFTVMFTGNAVVHLWQSYNARVSNPIAGNMASLPKGGSKTGSQVPSRVSAAKTPPVRSTPLPQPVRVPVLGGTGGFGGLIFQSKPGSLEPPLPQEQFNEGFGASVTGDVDEAKLASFQEEDFFG